MSEKLRSEAAAKDKQIEALMAQLEQVGGFPTTTQAVGPLYASAHLAHTACHAASSGGIRSIRSGSAAIAGRK